MKKIISLLLLVLIVVFSACSINTPEVVESKTDIAVSDTEITTPTDVTVVTEPTEPAFVPAESPVSYYGELKVSGNKIISSKTGKSAMVTGMSFFWSNWSQSYYTASYVDKMVDEMGCEIVRASYGVDDNGVPYNRGDENLIKTVVRAAIARDIYVIIDWHSHGAHKNANEAVKFFGAMAKEFGDYDNVIFEVYNEPTQISWGEVKKYAEKVIKEIRKYSDNLIVVGSPTWSQDVDVAAKNPIKAENIAYTLHFYAGTHKGYLRDKAEKAMKKGLALFVTEWGSVNADGNGAVDKKSTNEWIKWCNKYGISCCNWAINDKNESSSIYKSNGKLTKTGEYIKQIIADRTKDSEWKTGMIPVELDNAA